MKALFEIDPRDNTEDLTLNFYNEQASNLIEELLNRDFSYKSRTQYYDGTGTFKLLLKNRPVFISPLPEVYVDSNGKYGSVSGAFTGQNSQLTYGTDFYLRLDSDDAQSSRSAILYRVKDTWSKAWYRQAGLLAPFMGELPGSIKVTYTAGYTVDSLPAGFRLAANMLVAKIRYLFPLGMLLNSESYEERSLGLIGERKDWLLADVKPILLNYRNWAW